jgi:hypothetical protein
VVVDAPLVDALAGGPAWTVDIWLRELIAR